MSRAEAARDKAARLAAQRHTAQVVDPETVPDTPSAQPAAPAPSLRPATTFQRKSVRVTLDLAPALYDDFDDWRRRIARQTGMPKIKSVDVLRVLLRRLMADEALAAQVIEALREEARRRGHRPLTAGKRTRYDLSPDHADEPTGRNERLNE